MPLSHYLVFTLDDQSYALRLDAVERVLRAVQMTRVPEAPEILSGLVNLHGTIIPVLNIRERFRLNPRDLEIEDRMIVVRTATKAIAVIVDRVEGVVEFDVDRTTLDAGMMLPDMGGRVEGVAISKDHTVLIYDMNKLFSSSDISCLNLDPHDG